MSPGVVLDPPAVASVWHGVGEPHSRLEVGLVDLQPGDALIEIELSTICASDVHTTSGHRSTPTPTVLGHEQVGRVVALGDGARRADGTALRIGDRVVWSVTVSCFECDRCLAGLPQKCRRLAKFGHQRITDRWALNGAFATHAHLPVGTAIVAVGDGLPAEVLAPISCGTATAWAAMEAARDGRDARSLTLLITGAGLIGLTAAAMGHASGMHVTVVDPDPRRRALALRFGAADVIDPVDGLAGRTFSCSIEASGSPLAVASALDALDVGGAAVLVGSVFPTAAVPLNPESFVRRLATLRGVHNYTPQHLQGAAEWMTEHHERYPFGSLVSAHLPLTELDEALRQAATDGHVRVAVR